MIELRYMIHPDEGESTHQGPVSLVPVANGWVDIRQDDDQILLSPGQAKDLMRSLHKLLGYGDLEL